MLTQPMETTLSPQAITPPSPKSEITGAHSLGDDISAIPEPNLPSNGVVTTVGKREVGRVTRPDRGLRKERGLFRGR
jgi:hypothetical protein